MLFSDARSTISTSQFLNGRRSCCKKNKESRVASASATPRFGLWDPCESAGSNPMTGTHRGKAPVLTGRAFHFASISQASPSPHAIGSAVRYRRAWKTAGTTSSKFWFPKPPVIPATCPILRQQVAGPGCEPVLETMWTTCVPTPARKVCGARPSCASQKSVPEHHESSRWSFVGSRGVSFFFWSTRREVDRSRPS